ncbi:DUF6340 family protein [Bacteroides sedimenti]|uniref:Tetratricopeptide repeat protein n=1 Tax=Bacteroides sedimenti TaxID=2136147 RepID=A0ABN6Z440_9BACE
MAKYRFIFPLLFTLMISSCATIDQVDIDYLQSAKIIFPTEVRRVAIVNNVVTDNRKSVINKEDSINVINRSESTFQGDASTMAESLAQNVAAANYFDQVLICDSALRKDDKLKIKRELSQDEVKELTGDLGVDMLLSVEDINIKTDQRAIYENGLFHIIVDAKVSPVIKIYSPTRSTPIVTVSPEDEIFWDEYGQSFEEAKRRLIKEKQQIQEASDFAGEIPAKYILPSWNSTYRQYYSSGSVELRDASVFVREDSWDDALQLWMKAYESKHEKTKMRAAFNIALYYEMHDDIDKALEWVEKAQKIVIKKEGLDKKPNQESYTHKFSEDYMLISHYILILNERKTDLPTLNLQMKRFNDNF